MWGGKLWGKRSCSLSLYVSCDCFCSWLLNLIDSSIKVHYFSFLINFSIERYRKTAKLQLNYEGVSRSKESVRAVGTDSDFFTAQTDGSSVLKLPQAGIALLVYVNLWSCCLGLRPEVWVFPHRAYAIIFVHESEKKVSANCYRLALHIFFSWQMPKNRQGDKDSGGKFRSCKQF